MTGPANEHVMVRREDWDAAHTRLAAIRDAVEALEAEAAEKGKAARSYGSILQRERAILRSATARIRTALGEG